jgi:hypothetical protein
MFDLYAEWFKTLQDDISHTLASIDHDCPMEVHSDTDGKKGWTQQHMTIHGDVL